MTRLPPPDAIDTERLRLRPWARADAAELLEALHESVDHLLPWIPWARAEAPTPGRVVELLSEWMEQRASGANVIYAIRRRADERLLGGAGLYARVGPGRLEIGYWIRRTEAGFGYATEAAGALCSAAFDTGGVTAVEIHTDPANHASRRVPDKLGFRLAEVRRGEGRGEAPGLNTVVYVRESEANG